MDWQTLNMMTDPRWRCEITFEGATHICRVVALHWEAFEGARGDEEISPVIVYPTGVVDPVAGAYRMFHLDDEEVTPW